MTQFAREADRSKSRRRVVAVLLVLLLFLLLGVGAWYRYSMRSSAILAGQVVGVESNRRPIASAEVFVVVAGRIVRTDQQGKFQLKRLPAGPIDIKVSAIGYETKVLTPQMTRGRQTWVDVVLAPVKPSEKPAVLGLVVDAASGRPLADATVSMPGSNRPAVQADPQGRFRFADVAGHAAEIRAEAQGYQRATASWNGGTHPLVIKLTGSATLKGRVITTYENARPIAGAAIHLIGTDRTVQTDRNGQFHFESLRGGQKMVGIEAAAEGYSSKQITTDLPAEGEMTTEIRLPGVGKLGGTVVWQGTGDTPIPVPMATINVKAVNQTTVTGRDGQFAVDGLPPEPVTLTVKAPGFCPREVDRDPRTDTSKPIPLIGDSSVGGRLVDAAYDPPRPIGCGVIGIDQSPLTARSGPDGRFSFEAARSGAAKFIAAAPGYQPCEISRDLQSGEAVSLGDIALKGNTELEGTVVRKGTQTPIPNAVVRIGDTALSAKTDAQGRFRVAGLTPAPVDLAVSADGYRPTHLREEMVSGKNSLQVPLVVPDKELAPAAVVARASSSVSDGSPQVARAEPGGGPQGGAGSGPSGRSGPNGGVGGDGNSGPGPIEARNSWRAISEDDKLERLVFYIATGTRASRGRVYMTSKLGTILSSVGLEYPARGMAFQKQKEEPGFVVAIPRDRGEIMRIDKMGNVSTIVKRDPLLPHPVDVGACGNSDRIFMADDMANILAHTNANGDEANIFRQRPSSGFNGPRPLDQGMSVAVTGDRHVVFSSAGQPGVYRFPINQPDSGTPVLPQFGGVAADPLSARWTAAQPPNEIHVYNAERKVGRMLLPEGMVHYRDGLLTFSNDDGWLCAACQEKGKPDSGIWLCLFADIKNGQAEKLFRWDKREWKQGDMPDVSYTDREINDFVVARFMGGWPHAILPGGMKSRTDPRHDAAKYRPDSQP